MLPFEEGLIQRRENLKCCSKSSQVQRPIAWILVRYLQAEFYAVIIDIWKPTQKSKVIIIWGWHSNRRNYLTIRHAQGKNFTECQREMLRQSIVSPRTNKSSNQRIKRTQDLLVTIRITCRDFLTANSGRWGEREAPISFSAV